MTQSLIDLTAFHLTPVPEAIHLEKYSDQSILIEKTYITQDVLRRVATIVQSAQTAATGVARIVEVQGVTWLISFTDGSYWKLFSF